MPARTYTMAELAEQLGYSVTALYRLRRGDKLVFDGGQELPLIRVGRKIRVPIVAVDRLCAVEPAAVEPTEVDPPVVPAARRAHSLTRRPVLPAPPARILRPG